MRLQDHIDFTTLQWVKPELDDTLSIARDALESSVDEPGRAQGLRTCIEHLHQVHGTLQIVELYGAALVASEMETLAAALAAGQVAERDEAYAALMRGLMQLPDYLERLSSGHRDVPVVLLPLINELRALCGAEALPESALFHPNLDAFLPAGAPAAMSEAYAAEHRGELAPLRAHFQQQLLGWFRRQNPEAQLAAMRKTLLAIAARCFHVHGRRLWWIAAGLVEGLEQGMLKDQAGEVRQLIGKVDRQIRRLIEDGEDGLRGGEADEIASRMLYLVAQSRERSPLMEALRSTYALDTLLPAADEVEHARGSMAGHNRALLDSVSKALKDDLLRVKDALDLYLRQPDADPAQLAPQGEVLERVGDTLGMLALAVPRRVIDEQHRVLEDIVNRVRPDDEESLLDVAGALLYVEASLDDHIESLGSEGSEGADHADEAGANLPRSEALGVIATLMQEAIANTGKVKEAIVGFVESGWQHETLIGAPMLMDEVCGALNMLSSPRPADLARALGRFIGWELLAEQRVPSGTQMDHLADALAALEYYLEAAREHRGGLEHILDVAEHSLALLGYWPLPEDKRAPAPLGPSLEVARPAAPVIAPVTPVEVVPAPAEAAAPAAEGSAELDWVEIEEEVVEQAPIRDPLADETGFNAGAEGIDDDIRDIFLEEMQEEIDNLVAGEKAWLADPAQLSALTGIRRSFHTLKGSGRLVGAGVLGEFAWKVEDMLNRVLDGSIQPDADVQSVVHQAIAALPQLQAALKGEGTPDAPLTAIMRTAEQLAAGRPARVEDHLPAGTETVRRIVRRRVPRVDVEAAAQAVPTATLGEAPAEAPAAEVEAETEAAEVIPLPVLPPVDPVLLEILRSEVAQYQQSIRAAMAKADGELPVGEELLRAVHTLHGAIAMVDIGPLMQLLSPLEGLFKRLRASGRALSPEGVGLLGEAVDIVDTYMRQFDAAEPVLPPVDELTARIVALRDAYPESRVPHVLYGPLADEPEVDAEPAAGTDALTHAAVSEELVAALGAFDHTQAAADEAERDRRAEAERLAAEQAATERLAAERAAAEQAESERRLAEQTAAEQAEAARLETERLAAEQAETERREAERRVEDERRQAERAAAERAAAEQAATERALAAERAEAERQALAAAERQAAAERAAEQAAATATQAALPEQDAVDPARIDADLLEVFAEEAREILDHADGVLAAWHVAPGDTTHIAELQRDLHTLKGGARISGLLPIGDLSHAIETLLEQPVADEAAARSLIGVLEASFDRLNGLLQLVVERKPVPYPRDALARLQALVGGVAEPAGEKTAAVAETAPAETPAPAPAAAALPEFDPAPAPTEEARPAQEQIRVRADLLDDLVNHAGEVAIYRSRLEQQVAGYRFNLVELEQTVARLRSQLRMLEIETEAQIIARFQREQREVGMAAFDPLELDRYSQLQQYSRALAESVSDLVSIQSMLDELTRQAETLLIQQSRVSAELQDGLLRTRMLPFDTMVPNLRRTLRQAAKEEGKQAQLYVDGAHGEMDRNLLDRIKAPFEHMLRNAIAHGIESPEDRRKAGKPVEGAVHITVAREATEVVIRVSDDGRGLDREAIRKRGIERGLLRPETRPTDNQLLSLITQPGFSTASHLTQLAGRGVGMDVVANEIKQLGGSISIESEEGQGSTFILRLPFTLAVTQAMLVRVGESTYAIPVTAVQGVAQVQTGELAGMFVGDEPTFRFGNEDYALHELSALLDLPPGTATEEGERSLLLTRSGDLRAAIGIDAVLGSREIVVKSVGPQISSVPGLLGATIMGDGSVLVILDLAPLVRHGMLRREQRLAEGLAAVAPVVIEEERTKPLVMVVDDSITMRKVTGRVLERHDYEVATAKDGVDALEKLHDRVPDLMLLDIEMPRMDGYELATEMKADPRLAGVPIIMITSRTGDKHRQRALDIGVDRYLGKPYQEPELLAQIAEVLAARRKESAHG